MVVGQGKLTGTFTRFRTRETGCGGHVPWWRARGALVALGCSLMVLATGAHVPAQETSCQPVRERTGVTLMAAHLIGDKHAPVRTAAWYPKQQATFSETIALVRRCLWSAEHFSTSGAHADVVKVPRSLYERFTDALCYAA